MSGPSDSLQFNLRVHKCKNTLKQLHPLHWGVRFVFRTLSLFKQLQMNNSLVDNEHADDSYVIVTVLLFH